MLATIVVMPRMFMPTRAWRDDDIRSAVVLVIVAAAGPIVAASAIVGAGCSNADANWSNLNADLRHGRYCGQEHGRRGNAECEFFHLSFSSVIFLAVSQSLGLRHILRNATEDVIVPRQRVTPPI
jgi:hypothetical protein